MRYDKLPYERIRHLREDNDLTQKDVAKILNVCRNTYGQYELGMRQYSVSVIVKLAVFYNVSTDYLMGVSDDPKPYPRIRKSNK